MAVTRRKRSESALNNNINPDISEVFGGSLLIRTIARNGYCFRRQPASEWSYGMRMKERKKETSQNLNLTRFLSSEMDPTQPSPHPFPFNSAICCTNLDLNEKMGKQKTNSPIELIINLARVFREGDHFTTPSNRSIPVQGNETPL